MRLLEYAEITHPTTRDQVSCCLGYPLTMMSPRTSPTVFRPHTTSCGQKQGQHGGSMAL